MKPIVSILVLTYNRVELSSQYIPRILDRAGNIPVEMLIWDNGSEDGSYDWAHSFEQADCRVSKAFGHHKNIGMEAFNPLAESAKGKYIIKVDDDIEVPERFAERLVSAFEQVNEKKLLFLGWDMPWPRNPRSGGDTFATRSGMTLYQGKKGKIVQINEKDRVLIHYDPSFWMINGVCRFSPRKKFIEIGGHPKGIIYGVDKHISARAAEHGYWIGYMSSPHLVYHRGIQDTPKYRAMKDIELQKVKSPRHV
jgi:GT2 family glycosyltransferase